MLSETNVEFSAERNQISVKVQKNNISGDTVTCNGNAPQSSEPTWVHEIFQGTLTSETRCLNCETVSSKDEHFFDLQVRFYVYISSSYCYKSSVPDL